MVLRNSSSCTWKVLGGPEKGNSGTPTQVTTRRRRGGKPSILKLTVPAPGGNQSDQRTAMIGCFGPLPPGRVVDENWSKPLSNVRFPLELTKTPVNGGP